MKKITLFLLLILSLFLVNCSNNKNDVVAPKNLEVEDFIWKGLNLFYFWQSNVPNLADSKFANQDELNTFLSNANSPEDLFDGLLYNTSTVDKYSWIVDDYVALEEQFQGITKNNGVEFGLVRLSGSDDVFGYVRYILPNSNASDKNIKRGDLFLEVDGQQLTIDNFRTLLFGDNDSYTLGLASISNNTIALTGNTVDLTKVEYTENPVFITKSFSISGQKIGYILYNAFTANFDEELNNAFAQLKSDGITDLVLDLRYNGGGSVRSATQLASMITGQFNGDLFTREHWNDKLQSAFEDQNPGALINNFTDKLADGTMLNTLNLTSLYVLVTGSSASASELVINGLNPYITVKLIGTQTEGKYVASVTLYDSENFTRSGANPNHTYAMQPIVLEEVNKLGVNDKDGFDPDILLAEDFENLGILGDENEPLLQSALNDITGAARTTVTKKSAFEQMEEIANSKSFLQLSDQMYINKGEALSKITIKNANR
jgi:C-terminal processing protease CtpA/Prc